MFQLKYLVGAIFALQSIMCNPLLAVREGDALLTNEINRTKCLSWAQAHHFTAVKEAIATRCLYEATLTGSALPLKIVEQIHYNIKPVSLSIFFLIPRLNRGLLGPVRLYSMVAN